MLGIALLGAALLQSPAATPDPRLAAIESHVRDMLRDPDSAKFTWQSRFVWGQYHPAFKPRYEGWITCGTVNAKNSYGGYEGALPVIGIVDGSGNVIVTDVTEDDGPYDPFTGTIADTCSKLGIPISG